MDQAFSNRVARFLATLLVGMMMKTPSLAQDLTLPNDPTAPVALFLSQSELTADTPSDLLAVFVGTDDPCCEERTPMAGRYAQADDYLTFAPAFGFAPGQDYMARIRTAEGEELVPFRIASEVATIAAAVTEIYPSGDVLPENTLRFYIHFSVPMQPGVAFDYIKLRDGAGVADEAAFMRFKQELWNEDRTRLTILIDPGRIKREVATNVELGPAMRAGQSYTLSVDAGWPSAYGNSELPAFEKRFTVTAPLRERPDARLWSANEPCAGTQEPLTITFDRPFDRHLLTRTLRVDGSSTGNIAGTIEVSSGERSLNFTPHQLWPFEDLHLLANATLEDVAGNNFQDLLDQFAGQQQIDPLSTNLPISIQDCAG